MSFLKKLFGGQQPNQLNTNAPTVSTFTREGVRAQYKSKEYFDSKYVSIQKRLESDLAFYQKLIDERGEHYDKYKLSEFIIGRDYEMLFDAGFSRGDNVLSLKPFVEKATYHFIQAWHLEEDNYSQALSILSLGVLLDVDKTYFDQIDALFRKDHYNDYLLSYLLRYKVSDTIIVPTLLFPDDDALKSLMDITTSSIPEAQKKMNHFLSNQWYTRQNLESLYNAHLSDDKYLGYWSYEAAAITKIMKLDDSSYKDNAYYPYDLMRL
ncbi:DUF1911 domain-containing protein [Fibrella sp. HMF5335]|uniref:DUF1911 domain-containing protein n=1 Tax=Fibrella rubiginis TaxID=2817060 RepID=A0A939GFT5_9BACT|nr:PoNe immunity protein domain-containing protein [Fibrella rubiginis]MBO0935658.1 DUF1911 domain-containing protein [Fibrella rubiginis]